MNDNNLKVVQEHLKVLLEQPLSAIERNESLISVNFTALDNRVFSLQIICSMRLTHKRDIILAKNDIVAPKNNASKSLNFDWDAFDWRPLGNNHFDDMVEKHITNSPFPYIVEKIALNKFYDLKIFFKNDFTLELFAEASENSELWRFLTPNHPPLIINATGIAKP